MSSAAATAPSKAGLGDQALRAAPARLGRARARDAAVTAARLTARWRRPQKSVIARWTIQPRLLGVPSVANVAIWGFHDRQLQVQVDPERLAERGVTLQQIVETSANAQISSTLSFVEGSTPGTGGFIETPQQRLGARHVFDRLTDPEELGKVPVEGTGGRLRLTDVATVVEDHQPLIGDAFVNDADGLLVVEKFPGANTLDVTRARFPSDRGQAGSAGGADLIAGESR
jgi:multidrug efflux pump subunit AcrB